MNEEFARLQQLVSLYGPPGEENAVQIWLLQETTRLGYDAKTDAKGNVAVHLDGDASLPSLLVTAHMDEIALMITQILPGGKILVAPLGGVYPWKWGEGPVDILTHAGPVKAVLSFGSIHTEHEASVAKQAREKPLEWKHAALFTGLNDEEMQMAGLRPGLRVCLDSCRRTLTFLPQHIAGPFLDDRADLEVWLRALEILKHSYPAHAGSITFLATASEEVGGLGARYHLARHPADLCVALEIGPLTPDANFPLDDQPTIWVKDGYAAMDAVDAKLLTQCTLNLGQHPHWQYLSRGGSDASCCAAQGLCARPVTLGLPVDNSHGYEIMHKNALDSLTLLLIEYMMHCFE